MLKPSNMQELEEAVDAMCRKIREKQKLHSGQKAAAAVQVQPEKSIQAASSCEAGSFIVKNAIDYMEKHYVSRLTLGEVADQCYVSQWHLSKLLNKHQGQSFSDILNGIRINAAKNLLKNPSLRIGEISEMVGFVDMAHFSRVFKKLEGISANEYRNQL